MLIAFYGFMIHILLELCGNIIRDTEIVKSHGKGRKRKEVRRVGRSWFL